MPTFQQGWFNRIIAAELQQFYFDVMAGKQPRLIIQAPPRSGKSELFSRRFPAWAFGQNPNLQMIAASYSADLSSRMNRDVQRIIDSEEYAGVFPETSFSSNTSASINSQKNIRNSEIFEIAGYSGSYRSAGVGGGITGMGADIAIIDDPVKDAKEANSQTYRDSVWDWYTSTFYTRLSPKSGILLGMTRWHEGDLAGRLLADMKNGGDQWRVVSFPAIAEEDEEYRKEGDALHPERYDLTHLTKIKKAVGTQTWNALYQQRPSSKGGDVIKRAWFKRYSVLPLMRRVIIAGDTAQKVKQHNDFSVFIVAGIGIDGGLYIIDLIRGKWEAPELERKLEDIWNKYRASHKAQSVYIEDKSSGTGLIQSIQRKRNIPIKGVQVDADKYTRVLGIQGFIESGYVFLPDGAEWVEDFLSECEKFTATDSHKHDDQVDTLTMAITELSTQANILDIL
ncbi:MAG: chaperone and heat shock protein 70 [Pseudomonadota bacterium]|jgi:predicted phage terminase large subunit-like protein